jgi:serine/threonine protein kinase
MSSEKLDSLTPTAGPRYELLKELGRGGMGVAHLALAKGPRGFSKLVVLKMMRPSLVGDPASHRQFLEEARISARLAHPNVVQVHEVRDHEGTPTMVMEYLEGKSLSKILWDDGLPAPRNLLLYILTKALAGLHAAHDLRDYDGTPLNLVHRDASPHNIFVTFDGQIKVLDFGIAKAEGSEVETRAGAAKGKLRYMPPEQFLQLPVDRRVDVFAVGVTLWEVLAGRRFWDRATDDEVVADLIAKKLPALPPNANVPPDLAAICARAIAPECDQRYATAGRLQRDIEDHLSRQPDRVGGDDVAVFMHYRFDVEQDSAKHFVQSHVRSVQQAAVDGAMDPTLVLTGKAPPAEAGGGSASGAQGVSSTASRTPVPPRRSKVRWLVLASTGIALLVMVATAGVVPAGLRGAPARDPSGRTVAGEAAAACEPDFKPCQGGCLSIDRPDLGCGAEGCHSCTVPNATPRCNRSHACDIAVCYHGFQDCNGDVRDGCETNVRTDPDNCGACGRRCPPLPHAERGCGDVCTIWRCEPGHRDCNGVAADGCEVSALDDAANCGACGHACAASEKCRNGTCR